MKSGQKDKESGLAANKKERGKENEENKNQNVEKNKK